MTEITPAPWLRDGSNTVYSLHERSGRGGKIVECNRMWLHVYFDRDVSEAEQEATINAVMALPELLSAVRGALKIVALWNGREVPEDHLDYEENKALYLMQEQFLAAIAKAEGRAS